MAGADSLMAAARWFEASIAYERVYFLSDDATERVLANLQKAEALKQLGEFSKARGDLQRSLTARVKDAHRLELLYQLALCSYLDGDGRSAESFLMQLDHHPAHEASSRTFLLRSLVMADLEQYEEIKGQVLEWLEAGEASTALRVSIMDRYHNLMTDPGPPEPKDPHRARMWSTFLPGAGQWYAGSPAWGALNLASQLTALAGFGVLAWNAYYVAGVVVGLGPFQSLYFGGIRQAGELAIRQNNSRQETFQAAMGEFLLDVANQLDD